jgi:hypothetical protein
VRQVFEAMLPQEAIDCLCKQFGVIERQRKRHLGMFVRAMVISAGTPGGAYQADVLRSYLECEVPHVARSAFYRWFDEPLEQFMDALAQRALAYARAQQVDLSGPLCGVKDWDLVEGLDGHDVVGEARDAGPRQYLPRGGVDRQRPGRAGRRGPPHARYEPNTRLDGDQGHVMEPGPASE